MFHIHLARRPKSLILVPTFAPLTHKTIHRIVLFNRSCLPKGSNPIIHLRDSTRLRCPKTRCIRISLFDRGTVLALSLLPPPAAVDARTPSCRSRRSGSLETYSRQTKKTPYGVFLVWRRKRDSNPRAGESRPNGLANRPLRPTWVFLRIKNFVKKKWRRG